MTKGIDHIVLAVNSLRDAAGLWEQLGFKVTPTARHSWGTENRLVQLNGSFLEVLAIGENAELTEPSEGVFSFGAFNRDFLLKGEGASMFVMDSTSAADDREAYTAAGLPEYAPFSFERIAVSPEGEERQVAFDLTFTADPLSGELGFFTCHNKFPENFWKAEYQSHPNTVRDLSEVIFVADDPADHHEFLKAFIGERTARLSSLGVEIETSRGTVKVLSPSAYESLYGVKAPTRREGLKLAALGFSAENLESFGAYAEALGGRKNGDFWVIEPERMAGVAVICS
ncbi:Glyoxalase-like domain-containing protein [Pseudovibrio ascidiaceicola]|uniref:Glyoxalase-like domain-containing protein n=1 Tax=Pseudovibrio ascidiaceicola TaxID=285279 RepID=A0A1I4C0M1_9HYPH|nr:VOC family protein [Pseudovibrio ascidiaceicola]SFK74313.1 Glyoxalase-like domain-containing protein [Pseudovibrio ascidiaceicola]